MKHFIALEFKQFKTKSSIILFIFKIFGTEHLKVLSKKYSVSEPTNPQENFIDTNSKL